MTYQILLAPVVAAIAAQIIKAILHGAKGHFSWRDLIAYGGMPSSHAALVISLIAIVGYSEGWTSAALAITVILAIIVIRDAAGLRRLVGQNAKAINNLVHDLPPEKASAFQHLEERVGHTPWQLFLGSLLGLVVAILFIIF